MSKLLSDEELRTSYPLNTYSVGEQNELIELINTQKRLYAEMVVDIDTDVDIPETLKKIYSDGYSKGYNDRTYENSYNSDDFRMAEAIAPAVAKVRSRYDKQCKIIRMEKEANQ